MWEELLAKINNLKKSGGVGWGEKKGLTNNGNHTIADTGGFGTFAKIADEPADLSKVTSYTVADAGKTYEITSEEFEVQGTDGFYVAGTTTDEQSIIMIISTDGNNDVVSLEKGVWVRDQRPAFYIQSVTFETIHPIDKKYLPEGFGGGGPVVIDLPISEDVLFSGADIPVGDDIAAQLDMAAENYIPVNIPVEVAESALYRIYRFNLCQIEIIGDGKIFRFMAYFGENYYSVAYAPKSKLILGQEFSVA